METWLLVVMMERLLCGGTGRTRIDLNGQTGNIVAIKFAKDGNLVATASWDSTCRVWEATTGQLVRKVNCGSDVFALVWTGEKSFVSGNMDGRIKLWSVDQDGDSLRLQGHSRTVYSLDYQPSSAVLASGSSDKTVIVQKVNNSTSTPAPLHTLTGHKDRVYEVKFSPSDPQILATYDRVGEVRLWDILNGNHIFQCGPLGGYWFE